MFLTLLVPLLSRTTMDFEVFDVIDYSSSEEEEILERIRRPRRMVRNRGNPFEIYDDEQFKIRFRFAKRTVIQEILPLVVDGLQTDNDRGSPISPVIQLLICLRFYATSSFQVCNNIFLYFN